MEDDSIIETEIDDEVQDWKNLTKTTGNALPKRGEKDYEPDGTSVQISQLEESQNSMYNALSCPRGHIIKQNIRCYWDNDLKRGLITKPKGSFLQTCGKVDSDNKCWLNANEFVYLSERGTIEPWFSGKDVSMDMNSAYAYAFQHDDQIDQYQVYAHLKRHGYIVLDHEPTEKLPIIDKRTSLITVLWKKLLNSSLISKVIDIYNKLWYPPFHPLHFLKSKYINYSQIYESIKLIPFQKPNKSNIPKDLDTKPSHESDINMTFDVWKPTPQFSKKNPPTPNFQVVVLNVNKYNLPTLSTLQRLFAESEVSTPTPKKEPNQMAKLKNGKGNVLLAIVDYGVINFIKLSQGTFSEENVWFVEDKTRSKPSNNFTKKVTIK